MKALEYIETLDSKEIKEFQYVIANRKNDSLEKLFKLLLKYRNEEPPGHDLLYKKLYQKKYSKDKDYLVRNMLRLLSDELEEFLIKAEYWKVVAMKGDVYRSGLFRMLFRRGLHERMERFTEKTWEEVRKSDPGMFAFGPMHFYLQYLRTQKRSSVKDSEELLILYKKRQTELKRYFTRFYRRTEEWINHEIESIRLRTDRDIDYIPPAATISLMDKEVHHNLTEIIYEEAKGYLLEGLDYIKHLEKLAEKALTVEPASFRGMYPMHLGRIAWLYMQRNELEGMHSSLQKLLEEEVKANGLWRIDSSTLLNTAIAFTLIEKYADASTLLRQRKEEILQSEINNHLYYLTIGVSQLLLGNASAAQGMRYQTDGDLSKRSDYYFRLLDIAAFYDQQEYEQVERELTNFRKVLKTSDAPMEVDYNMLTEAYKKLLEHTMATKEKKTAIKEALKAMVSDLKEDVGLSNEECLLLVWLETRAEQLSE